MAAQRGCLLDVLGSSSGSVSQCHLVKRQLLEPRVLKSNLRP